MKHHRLSVADTVVTRNVESEIEIRIIKKLIIVKIKRCLTVNNVLSLDTITVECDNANIITWVSDGNVIKREDKR